MTTLAEARADLAACVASVGGLLVFDAWPTNVTPPCAVISMAAGQQRKTHHWETGWRITLIGPGGDNLAASMWTDDMTVQVARVVSDTFTAPVGWEQPTRTTVAGRDHYTTTLTVTRDIDGV